MRGCALRAELLVVGNLPSPIQIADGRHKLRTAWQRRVVLRQSDSWKDARSWCKLARSERTSSFAGWKGHERKNQEERRGLARQAKRRSILRDQKEGNRAPFHRWSTRTRRPKGPMCASAAASLCLPLTPSITQGPVGRVTRSRSQRKISKWSATRATEWLARKCFAAVAMLTWDMCLKTARSRPVSGSASIQPHSDWSRRTPKRRVDRTSSRSRADSTVPSREAST